MHGSRDRVQAALAGEIVDRPAWTLWRHWPVDDQDAATHARVAVAHHRRLRLDLLKLTPSAAFMAEAWGAVTQFRGAATGVRDYLRRPIAGREDWSTVRELDPVQAPTLAREIEVVRLVRAAVGPGTPVLATVFSPLSVVRYLAGELFVTHLRQDRAAVTRAMRAIADTSVSLVRQLVDAGADGIYLSLFPASYSVMGESEYRELALPTDQLVLSAAEDAWLRVVHFHLPHPLLRIARDLPADFVSWEHTSGGPSLADGAELSHRAVLGGIDQAGALAHADAATVTDEARTLLRLAHAAPRLGLVVATSCSYALTTPEGNLLALRDEIVQQ